MACAVACAATALARELPSEFSSDRMFWKAEITMRRYSYHNPGRAGFLLPRTPTLVLALWRNQPATPNKRGEQRSGGAIKSAGSRPRFNFLHKAHPLRAQFLQMQADRAKFWPDLVSPREYVHREPRAYPRSQPPPERRGMLRPARRGGRGGRAAGTRTSPRCWTATLP